jgi:hypothetical protein
LGKKSRGKQERREAREREEAARPEEVRRDVGWDVMLDGKARVVVCGENTPFGVARDFQMSVYPAARSRGLVVTTRRSGTRVHLQAQPGPPLGERTARRARYQWDDWLDGNPHQIPLGPTSGHPGIRAQQLVDAALRAAKTRGLSVSTQVRDGGLTVLLHASPPAPMVRPGKYPWAKWFDGAEHSVDLTDKQWGHPQSESFRVSVQRAAKRHGLCAHALPVVGPEAFDPDRYPRRQPTATPMVTEVMVWADRPNGTARTLGIDTLGNGQPHAFPVGPNTRWPTTTAHDLGTELVRTAAHHNRPLRYRTVGNLGVIAHTRRRPLHLPGEYLPAGATLAATGLILTLATARHGHVDLGGLDLTGHDLTAADPTRLNLTGLGWDPAQPPRWPTALHDLPTNQWGRPLAPFGWRQLL